MRGSIRRRSKGSWEIYLDTGRDVRGKRLRHYETIRGSKKDAQRRLAELQVEVEKGTYIKPKKRITLGEWLNEWLNGYVKTNCSPRTLDGYRSILGHHVIPILGMIPLAQLQPQHIQQYYAQALSDGRTDGERGHYLPEVCFISTELYFKR